MLTVSVTTLRTGVLTDAVGGITGAGGSNAEGGGAGGTGAGGGGKTGTTGERIGGGGGVRGRFAGADLVAGVLGVGVLVSDVGTTLLMTLETDTEEHLQSRLKNTDNSNAVYLCTLEFFFFKISVKKSVKVFVCKWPSSTRQDQVIRKSLMF